MYTRLIRIKREDKDEIRRALNDMAFFLGLIDGLNIYCRSAEQSKGKKKEAKTIK